MLLHACQKEESSTKAYPIANYSNQEELNKYIGKNYNVSRSNLYGIPEKYLANSDALFGLDNTMDANANFIIAAKADVDETDKEVMPKNNTGDAKERSSTATYYNSYSTLHRNPVHKMTYNWDAYIYVENDGSMVAPADNDKVVFYALQVDFGNQQGAHTGLQWANGIKKVNWGGYVQPAYNSMCSSHSCNYSWSSQTPYRFRVWRLGINYATGKTQWGAWVKNMWNNQETYIGSFYSSSTNIWITNQSTWIETIKSGSTPLSNRNIQAVFSYLVYRDAAGAGPFGGAHQAFHALASYNDAETPPPSYKQDKNVSYTFDNIWWGVQTKSIRHKFNTIRTVPNNTLLW